MEPHPEPDAARRSGPLASLRRLLQGDRVVRRDEQRRLWDLLELSTWDWDVRTGELFTSRDPSSPGGEASRRSIGDFTRSVHPEDRARFRETLDRAAQEGSSFLHEFRLVLGDGSVRWREAVGHAVRDRRGRVTHVVGVGQDVTRRKEAEERLHQTELHYRRLVEQLPLATYTEGLGAGSASYISPQIADLVGYTAAEWVADPEFFGRVLHPDDRERILSGFAAMHRSGHSFDCEYRLIAKDGREVWIHDAAVVARDESGNRAYAQGYMIDITDRKRAEEALRRSQERLREHTARMEYQALHDALTGLPNRALFRDRAEREVLRCSREGGRFALLLIDLDRFKEVNDTLGHHSGDMLLCEMARRLERSVRRSDTVARLGGDEFAVIAPGLADAFAAAALADKLRSALLEPVAVGALAIEVEASVGIAIFPDHGADVETLTRRADVSMYVSKSTHSPIVYIDEYDQDALARLHLVSELRQALEHDQLRVYFQPESDVATGRTLKVEALVRWQHPERGLLGPTEFVPLAEQTGLIRSLTRFVLDQALAQCHAWDVAGRRVVVAVNITGRELVDLTFPAEVAGLLGKWSLDPTQLELEITETTLMSDVPRARTVLAELAELGIRLAVDDFGSGESSFSYLRRLPISVLKIDKAYVQGILEAPADEALVRSAIELGHNLGLEVVAEGVESAEVQRRLAALGCDTVQGYHLGRPQAAGGLAGAGIRTRRRSTAA